jgi:hypothetical protein
LRRPLAYARGSGTNLARFDLARRHKSHKKKKHKGDVLLRFSSFCDFCGAFQKLNAEIMIEMLAYRSVSIVKLAPAGNVTPRSVFNLMYGIGGAWR